MNAHGGTARHRLYRDADRAMLGGVCAGLAGYFGLNLRVTRILTFIAFLMAMPIVVTAYLAAVFLIPAEAGHGHRDYGETEASRVCWRSRRAGRTSRAARAREGRPGGYRQKADPASVRPTVADVRERYRSLDKRLAELERQVTSPRFQLEQEFRKL